jgi:hypothetical protein
MYTFLRVVTLSCGRRSRGVYGSPRETMLLVEERGSSSMNFQKVSFLFLNSFLEILLAT